MTAPSVPGSLEKGVRLFQGEGVSGVVYERMSAFFTFAALTPTPLPEGEGLYLMTLCAFVFSINNGR